MKKELGNKSEIKLIGLTARTNNKNEMNPQTNGTKLTHGIFTHPLFYDINDALFAYEGRLLVCA